MRLLDRSQLSPRNRLRSRIMWCDKKKGPTHSNAFGEVIEYAILIVRLLDCKYLIGVAMLLKIGMMRLEDCVEIEKNIS